VIKVVLLFFRPTSTKPQVEILKLNNVLLLSTKMIKVA